MKNIQQHGIKWLLEVDRNNCFTEDIVLEAYNSLMYRSWYDNTFPDRVYTATFSDRDKPVPNRLALRGDGEAALYYSTIAVGSLCFVASYLGHSVSVLNVPEYLRSEDILGRRVFVLSRAELETRLRSYGQLFIKSADHNKGVSGIVNARTLCLVGDGCGLFFCSEVVDIVSEYRVFVWRNTIQGIHQYDTKTPTSQSILDIGLIQETITRISEEASRGFQTIPTAYTLDFAVLSSGRTVLIEMHNFISCGLYGFRSTHLLGMLRAGWAFEQQRNNISAI